MTRQDFILLLARMDTSVSQLPPTTPLSSVAFLVAADRWIKQKPEDEYSVIFREELMFLLANGRFSFDEVPKVDESHRNPSLEDI